MPDFPLQAPRGDDPAPAENAKLPNRREFVDKCIAAGVTGALAYWALSARGEYVQEQTHLFNEFESIPDFNLRFCARYSDDKETYGQLKGVTVHDINYKEGKAILQEADYLIWLKIDGHQVGSGLLDFSNVAPGSSAEWARSEFECHLLGRERTFDIKGKKCEVIVIRQSDGEERSITFGDNPGLALNQ